MTNVIFVLIRLKLIILNPDFFIMNVIKTLLEKYNVQLSEELMLKFESILIRKEYQKDEIILEEGTISRYLYIVEKRVGSSVLL